VDRNHYGDTRGLAVSLATNSLFLAPFLPRDEITDGLQTAKAARPTLPIVYGFSSSALFRAAAAWGGDVIVEDMPTWWCETDQYGWDGPDPARAIREALRQMGATPG
jgi:hypothetical protein